MVTEAAVWLQSFQSGGFDIKGPLMRLWSCSDHYARDAIQGRKIPSVPKQKGLYREGGPALVMWEWLQGWQAPIPNWHALGWKELSAVLRALDHEKDSKVRRGLAYRRDALQKNARCAAQVHAERELWKVQLTLNGREGTALIYKRITELRLELADLEAALKKIEEHHEKPFIH